MMIGSLQRWWLWLPAMVFLGLGFLWKPSSSEITASQKDDALAVYISTQEERAKQYLLDSNFTSFFAERSQLRYLDEVKNIIKQIHQLESEDFAILLYLQDQAILKSHKINWDKVEAKSFSEEEESFVKHAGKSWLRKIYPLKNDLEASVFYPFQEATHSTSRPYPLFFLLGGILLLWLAIHHSLIQLLKSKLPFGFLLIAVPISALTISFLASGNGLLDARWPLTKAIFSGRYLGPSVLAVLLHSGLALWSFRWFYNLFDKGKHQLPKKFANAAAFIIYLSAMALLTGIAYWIKQLFTDSKLFFNLENILEINISGLAIATSMALVALGLFLYLFKLFEIIARSHLDLNRRIILMVSAILVSIPAIYPLQLGFPLWTWSLIAFILLVLLDLFIDSQQFNLTWLMVWTILFSAFYASLHYKYVLDKDAQLMKAYASELLKEDPIIKKKLNEIELQKDTLQILQQLRSDPYVLQHYTIHDDLQFKRLNDETQQQIQQFSTMPRKAYRGLEYLNRYDFLHSNNGRLIEAQGQVLGTDWALGEKNEQEEQVLYLKNNRLNYEWKGQEGSYLIFQRILGSYFKPLSLFAVFFLLFLIIVLFFFAIHRFSPMIPAYFDGIFQLKNSFSTRIQLWVIGIILGSSILIGMITILYFKTVSDERTEQQVFQQAQRAEEQLESLLPKFNPADSVLSSLQFPLLVYNASGELVTGNQIDLLQQKSMHASALEWLRLGSSPFTIRKGQKEGIAMYYASLNQVDGSIAGFIGLPYSYNNPVSQQELSNFVGSIFSLYVFLMFIAGSLAIWVANSITEPINQIGKSLSKLQLGNNAPLFWKNEDEIGLLIKEYNQALAKLEESTKQLKKSEREGAWREMAKQVAHEIKNPLTPMKLGVQHLMRAYQADPQNIGPLLQRMTNTLIEQIEGLTKIANEFSDFAKMPQANLQRMDLIPIVASVSHLFSSQNQSYQIHFQSALASFFTKIDKDQMLRVLNNLLTNAIEAIPSDREGIIQILLESHQDGVRIAVKDNGCGIPEDFQERVFYPNFTTKSSGTGIGLAMSRKIIEQFGGKIYFETKENIGTSFYIELEAA